MAGHAIVISPGSHVGRRAFSGAPGGQEFDVELDGRVRFLLNAFIEDRPGEHVSVDYLWEEGSSRDFGHRKVRQIAETQQAVSGAAVHGWACGRVDALRGVAYVDDVRLDAQPDNPRHALLVKAAHMLVQHDDPPKHRRDKAFGLAKALEDFFNNEGASAASRAACYFLPFAG